LSAAPDRRIGCRFRTSSVTTVIHNSKEYTMRQLLISCVLFLFSHVLLAAGNATPFGVEVGVAKLLEVQKQIGSQASLKQTGINRYSGGKMFEADGSSLNIEGVETVTLIFDQSDILAGVLVSMPKDPKALVKTFSGKYKLISNRVNDFMNNGYAKFQKGDTIIEINAPHMSFNMEVRYITTRLMTAFLQQSTAETEAKQKRKSDSL
jgi:hypothetical protein